MSDVPRTPLTERLLDLAVEYRSGASVVRATGEIDLCTAPRLAETLAGQLGPVVLDLTRVAFLSAAGVQAMLDVRELRVVAPRCSQVARVLDLTGLTAILPRYETVPEALSS
ncbi:STAS domain-containing protein [Amycolatopsis deserti]|uniref:STAS domain-containing protein n=1 Tax=Amycolatopsis deserti TaxID=185696 RepID=UPI00174EB405|nr:STAS domain-containing protein [Amycolatopsis deserti]